MSRSLVCAFLTRYDDNPGRREFVFAVKNCRPVRSGRHRGVDGRELAVALSRERKQQMHDYLRGGTGPMVWTGARGTT